MPKRTRRRWLWRGTLLALALGSYAHWVEPCWIAVTRHEVVLPIDRTVELAHLTDLHTTGRGRREETMLALLAARRPDCIVITGDTLEQDGTFEQCRPLLSALKAPLGIYMVRGNWETASTHRLPQGQSLREFLHDCGVTLLKNESVEIVPGLWLVGLDDFVWGAPDLTRATAAIPDGAARVALIHEPEFFDLSGADSAASSDHEFTTPSERGRTAGAYDLLLAGHTHGGQVRLPLLPPLFLPSGCGHYVEGWYEKPGARLYVSRGLGMSGLPFRFCCRPELAIHVLTPPPSR